ncbi:CocE/NonD family hydrolase C-terminal non-catalytic domain-containing protein, partial [Photobacterium sanctipauli]
DRNITHSGDVEFGEAASFDNNVAENWLQQRIDWFRLWLLDAQVQDQPTVRVFQMGGGDGQKNAQGRLNHGGHWIHGTEWPLPQTRVQQWFLRAGGQLDDQPEPEPRALSYLFDPTSPMPTVGGALTSGKPVFVGGAFDQKEDP